MAYETFERKSVRVEAPAITVRPEGRIACNAAASRLLENAGVKTVKILWDRDACGLALQATDKGDDNSYTIVFSPSRSATVTAKLFLRYIGWSSNRRQTLRATWDAQRRMLEAKLPARFVGSPARATAEVEEPVREQARNAKLRSPGASGNIRNWMALNEIVPQK